MALITYIFHDWLGPGFQTKLEDDMEGLGNPSESAFVFFLGGGASVAHLLIFFVGLPTIFWFFAGFAIST